MISLTKYAINASISERYASTSYEFAFENTNQAQGSNELRFEITIDPNAFISGFTANIDGELFCGETKEKKEAKKEYVAAKEKNENAILISQPFPDIPNVFQIKTNIDAKSKVLLTINIEQYLKKKLYFNQLNIEIVKEFPKYNIERKCDDIQMNIDIADKRGIYDIVLPSTADNSFILDENTLNESNTLCEIHGSIPSASNLNEFIVKYKVNGEQEESNILYDKNSKTFVHILNVSASGYIPRRAVFVIDKSGSMSGGKWRKTINATVTTLKQLKSGSDRYCVMFFNSGIEQSHHEMILANTESISQSIKYVNAQSAGGGTNINDALMKAIQLIQNDEKVTDDNLYLNQIILITDGEPNTGETNTNNIISNVMQNNRLCAHKISIFGFGVGSDRNDSSWINDLNHSFLKILSVNNNGIYKRIKQSQCDTQLNDYFNVISKPVAKDIKVSYDIDGITDIDLTQNTFHTLYDGNDIIICGAIRHHKTLNLSVNISAITGKNGKSVEISNKVSIDLSKTESCNNIKRIWAYLKLNQLAQRRLVNDDIIEFDDDDDAIPLALAMRYKFVTPWTSMIVVKHKQKIETEMKTQLDKADDNFGLDPNTDHGFAMHMREEEQKGGNQNQMQLDSLLCNLLGNYSDDDEDEEDSSDSFSGLDDDDDVITLTSGGPNPIRFEVKTRNTLSSKFCSTIYEGDSSATSIEIRQVLPETLQIVIDYMNQHQDAQWNAQEWINTFDIKTLSDIVSAANYMDINDLYHLSSDALNNKETELNTWIDQRINDIFAETGKTNVFVNVIEETLLVFDVDKVSLRLKDFSVQNMVYLVKTILNHIVFVNLFNEKQKQVICKYFVEEKVDGRLFAEFVEKKEFVAKIEDFFVQNGQKKPDIQKLQKLQNVVCLF